MLACSPYPARVNFPFACFAGQVVVRSKNGTGASMISTDELQLNCLDSLEDNLSTRNHLCEANHRGQMPLAERWQLGRPNSRVTSRHLALILVV